MSSTATASSNEDPPAHLINFGCGHPDASLLPVQEIADATQQALLNGEHGRKWLQYGRENGNPPARQALAEFLTTLYQSAIAVDPETLCFTSGVSHGVQATCRALQRMNHEANPTPEPPLCWVEDPTYFLIPAIFQQCGYELQAASTSPISGLDLQALEKQIKMAREAAPDRLLVVYSIPVHHNPLGISLDEDARAKLVELCETYRFFLIADEVYDGLSFPNTSAVQPMAMRNSNYVISTAAFTKILCPGIRCGWIQTSNLELMRRIRADGVLDSGGCSSQMSSGIVAQMIQSGALAPYLANLRAEYAKRCHHLCRLLQEASCSNYQFEFETPKGGYFLWVRVKGIDFAIDEAFRSFCRSEFHVDFKTGLTCSEAKWRKHQESPPNPQPFLDCMRLCFAYYDTDSLSQGVERLCQAIEAYPKTQTSSAL